jgi:UDP-N-acetylglucosamine--N-acetylmuramyl-(pentapeptide) pyrophosphoryl-undecaprenol N-acetylglucosamine transferase
MSKKIIIASGGTGGHMFPAAAVAESLRALGYDIILMTDKRGMRYSDNFKDDIIVELPVANIRQGGIFNTLKNIMKLIYSIGISIKIIVKYRAVGVVGFGGYPSFPTAMASVIMLKPLFIHEQNAILGRTNKLLKHCARKIFTSFDKTLHAKNNKNVIHTGNPVRKQISHYADTLYPVSKDTFNILVTGGSQGASILSQIMPEICHNLPKDIQHKLNITHQARLEDIQATVKRYKDYKINADVTDFINDMGQEIAKAHLVICRSGASTLAEIGIVGRPALYIPLPSAADDQQTINAQMAVDLGAGRLIRQQDFTQSYVAGIITEYYMYPQKLQDSANKAKLLSKQDSCHNIAKIIVDTL